MVFWFLGALAFFAFVFLSTSDASPSDALSQSQAKALFPSKVNRWLSKALIASAEHGVDPRVLLSIAQQESSGEELGFHPDGVSYGLLGLTQMALDDLGDKRSLEDLGPQEQFNVSAEFLALLKKREGTLYEALKWYNSGASGGGGYASEVLKRAGLEKKIPSNPSTQSVSGNGASTASAPAAQGSTQNGSSKDCGKYGFCDDDPKPDTDPAPNPAPDPVPAEPAPPAEPEPLPTPDIDPAPMKTPQPADEQEPMGANLSSELDNFSPDGTEVEEDEDDTATFRATGGGLLGGKVPQ
jgi:hypothetical protein